MRVSYLLQCLYLLLMAAITSVLAVGCVSYAPEFHDVPETRIEFSDVAAFHLFEGAEIVTGSNAVWVMVPGERTVLYKIDPQDKKAVARIEVGRTSGYPLGSALAVGQEAVWVTTTENGVLRINPQGNKIVARIPVEGDRPFIVTLTNDALWVGTKGSFWNSWAGSYRIHKIDVRSNQVVEPVSKKELSARSDRAAVGFGSLWIRDSWAETVFRTDPLSGQIIATIPMSAGSGWIAAGEGAIWVLNSKEGSVSRIDPRTNQVTVRIPIYIDRHHLSNEFPRPPVFSEGFIWVTSRDRDFWSSSPPIITAIDSETNQPVFTMHPPDHSVVNKFAAGYHSVWIPDHQKLVARKYRFRLNVYEFRRDK